jgi:transposase
MIKSNIKYEERMSKNKSYNNEFKFKVAIEMVKGDLTIAEIVSKYQVPRSVLTRWKKQLLDQGSAIFGASHVKTDNQSGVQIEKLHTIIGRLKVENDFLLSLSAKLKL